MKTSLSTLCTSALLMIISGSVVADGDDVYAPPADHPFNEFLLNTSRLINDSEMSAMRAQGVQIPTIETGVILWDEVDNISRPKTHFSQHGSAISISVE
ncbi:hypothetical protein [Methylophaga sp.]|uniref:hypothetical protein n=1 Tax=Methylophaga sp. TaxID=2024840 RepID=UPI0013FFA9A8|nr:hypothetical protein [Methylophaga sp.]MTI62897.1 hypothetical protein [Methylophaga sp.]